MLVANLGTPDGHDYWSMRRYLNEFLSDKRVIDYPRWKWQPLLQGIILTKRPFSSGANYKLIWNHELNESPLLTIPSKSSRHFPGWVRSAGKTWTLTQKRILRSLASCSKRWRFRETRMRCAPCPASSRAKALPIPEEAPVTSAVMPFKERIIRDAVP